ncbi:hypothetical protein M231_06271, partial [Tremella mesenterica]
MSHSDSDDERPPTRRRVLLNNSDNYKEWERSILSRLIQKDLDEVVEADAQLPSGAPAAQKAWLRKDRKAWAVVDESLSTAVHDVLPPHVLDINSTTPTGLLAKSLLDHLRTTYSAARATRKAELYRLIWRTDIDESDPMVSISLMRRAFNDLTASSVVLADSQLSYAILIALPSSYATLSSTFYMLGDPSSADVISAIHDEFRRRQTQENGALALQAKLSRSTTKGSNWHEKTGKFGSGRTKLPVIRDGTKPYCEFHNTNSHSTTDCQAAQR